MFQKFPGGAYPRTPKFLFFNLLQLILLNKKTFKKMVKLCFPLLLRFLATPLRHPMNNKHHFRNINLVIWVQTKTFPSVKIFYFAHCLCLQDVKTFSFLESQILVPRESNFDHISAPGPGFSLDGPGDGGDGLAPRLGELRSEWLVYDQGWESIPEKVKK